MTTETKVPQPTVTLDMRGTSCPAPLLGAKKLVDDLKQGQVLKLLSDCPGTHGRPVRLGQVHRQPHRAHRALRRRRPRLLHRARPRAAPAGRTPCSTFAASSCPGPIVEAKKLLNGMRAGETLKLVSNCPGIPADVEDWVKATGLTLRGVEESGRRRVRVLHREVKSGLRAHAHQEPLVQAGNGEGCAEIAGAAGFIVFRIAQNALKHMRGAGYELPAGAPYFAFLAEFLAFLTLCADRIAHARGDEAWRVLFTTTMANSVGGYLADNQADLLGGDSPEGYKKRFIALVNERSADYAGFRWTDDGPDYGFVRCFGHCVAETMAGARPDVGDLAGHRHARHRKPVDLMRGAMAGLLDPAPRRRSRGQAGARGE